MPRLWPCAQDRPVQAYRRTPGPVREGPFLVVAILYWVCSPGHLQADSAVAAWGRALGRHSSAAGILVANVAPDAARRWAQVYRSHAGTRLDISHLRSPRDEIDHNAVYAALETDCPAPPSACLRIQGPDLRQ